MRFSTVDVPKTKQRNLKMTIQCNEPRQIELHNILQRMHYHAFGSDLEAAPPIASAELHPENAFPSHRVLLFQKSDGTISTP